MKINLLVFLCLFPFLSFAQEQFNSCPIDTSKWLNLYIGASFASEDTEKSDEILSFTVLNYIVEEGEPVEHNCTERYLIDYSDSAQQFYAYNYYWDKQADTSRTRLISYIDLSKVKTLEIRPGHSTEFPIKTILDLSKIEHIQNLKNLPNLESISIRDGYTSWMPIAVNLSKWPCYQSLVKAKKLTSFSENFTYAFVADYKVHEDLKAITSLKKLELPYYVNNDLAEFKQLESITMPGAAAFFAHSLAKIPHLKSIYDWGNNVNSYACDVFFANLLNIEDTSHQLHDVHLKLLQLIAEERRVDGFYSLVHNEKTGFALISEKSDSVRCMTSGEIRNGSPTGVWNFRADRYHHYYKTGYLYDYTFKDPVYFPENGNWKYYFPNCVLGIEGNFKNGLKEGEWKFYGPDGKLQDIKLYKADEATGLFVTNSILPYDNWFIADRLTYYISNNEYYFMNEGVLYYKGTNGFESSAESETLRNKLSEMKEKLDPEKD